MRGSYEELMLIEKNRELRLGKKELPDMQAGVRYEA